MRLPRTLRLDSSDLHVFHRAATPGEWAIPGGFEFAERNPSEMDNKELLAMRSGWLGMESFGRASLVEVAEIEEEELAHLIEQLAAHLAQAYGAPDKTAARDAARREIEEASALCEHKINTLLALEREVGPDGLVERFRVIRPERARDHAKIWEIVPEDED